MVHGKKAKKKVSSFVFVNTGPTAPMELFAEVMEGSVNKHVDQRSCIPFSKIRPWVRSGVERLKKVFRGNGNGGLDMLQAPIPLSW